MTRSTRPHRHFSIDVPPHFCEECGKDWTLVMDGREGRRRRRESDAKDSIKVSEADFQRSVMELAELAGWSTLHVRTSMQQGRYLTATAGTMARGWPDLVLVRGSRLMFVELKGPKGRLTPDQVRVLGILERVATRFGGFNGAGGVEIHVWRPSDWADIEARLTQTRSPNRDAA